MIPIMWVIIIEGSQIIPDASLVAFMMEFPVWLQRSENDNIYLMSLMYIYNL